MMPKALRDVKISSFLANVNLVAFIISIETEASLLALLKLYIMIIIIYFYN